MPLSPPSWTFSLHNAPVKLPVSWRTPPILPTISSSSYHQEDGTGASEPTPPDCSTVFSPWLREPWTQLTPPLSETHTNPLPPEIWTISPPPPQPYHITGKNCQTFLCNSKCATHRWVGLYKPHVVTHSPLFTLDTFHTLMCVHNPTKDSVKYVCLHDHALKLSYTLPQPAAWLTMFSLYMYSICEAFVQFVFFLFMYR